MGDVIRRKIRIHRLLILFLITGILIVMANLYIRQERNHFDERDVRVKVNQLIFEWEEKLASGKDVAIEFEYPYAVVRLDGWIRYSTMPEFKKDKTIDVHSLGGVRKYVVPLNTEGKANDLLIVDLPVRDTEIGGKTKAILWLLLFIWVTFLVLLLHVNKIEREDIWKPVQQLHLATKAMLEQRTMHPVTYDYDGEVGTLCHDFRQMCEEIMDGYAREEKAKEKEQVLYASISHDLKTPVATISGYLEEILYDVVQTPEEIKDCAQHMFKKVMMLNKLIDDILEHSKAQLNELTIYFQDVYARDYFGSLLKSYQMDLQQKKYTLTYNLPKNVLLHLDTDRISEVLQNLIDNAVKYGKENRKIEIDFDIVSNKGNWLVVNVKDYGRGIEANDLPFIFDKFYRGNKARTLDIPGSGLGLNISKYIIEQHGGQIECDSIVGVGTTISFSLPIE